MWLFPTILLKIEASLPPSPCPSMPDFSPQHLTTIWQVVYFTALFFIITINPPPPLEPAQFFVYCIHRHVPMPRNNACAVWMRSSILWMLKQAWRGQVICPSAAFKARFLTPKPRLLIVMTNGPRSGQFPGVAVTSRDVCSGLRKHWIDFLPLDYVGHMLHLLSSQGFPLLLLLLGNMPR